MALLNILSMKSLLNEYCFGGKGTTEMLTPSPWSSESLNEYSKGIHNHFGARYTFIPSSIAKCGGSFPSSHVAINYRVLTANDKGLFPVTVGA